jgi:hypothetical protein
MQLKALALLAVTFLASVVDASRQRRPPVKHIMRMRHAYPNSTAPDALKVNGLACESTPTLGPITKHGGPIMSGTVNIYMIWYGKWSTAQKNILQNLATNIGKSPYFNVEKTYGVNGPVVFKGAAPDNYSQGRRLSDASLPKIVSRAITTGKLPADSNGVYFINTDPTVTETGGFCSQYCGFHTHAKIAGKMLKYAFIGNPLSCLAGCAPCNINVSPNGDLGVDAMCSVFAHELMETASDPLGTTWFDGQGFENADKCAYTYGSTSLTTKGAYFNMKIGTLNYLIQQNWKATGGCAKS